MKKTVKKTSTNPQVYVCPVPGDRSGLRVFNETSSYVNALANLMYQQAELMGGDILQHGGNICDGLLQHIDGIFNELEKVNAIAKKAPKYTEAMRRKYLAERNKVNKAA